MVLALAEVMGVHAGEGGRAMPASHLHTCSASRNYCTGTIYVYMIEANMTGATVIGYTITE